MIDYNEILVAMIKSLFNSMASIAIFNLIVIIIFLFFRKHEVAKKIIAVFGVSTIILVISAIFIIGPRVRDVKNDTYVVVENAKLLYNNDDGWSLGSGVVCYPDGKMVDVRGVGFFSFSEPSNDAEYYGRIIYGKHSKQLIYIEQTENDKIKGDTIILEGYEAN